MFTKQDAINIYGSGLLPTIRRPSAAVDVRTVIELFLNIFKIRFDCYSSALEAAGTSPSHQYNGSKHKGTPFSRLCHHYSSYLSPLFLFYMYHNSPICRYYYSISMKLVDSNAGILS